MVSLSTIIISLLFGIVLTQSGTDFISYHVYSDPTSAQCDPSMMQSQYAGYITANTHGLPCYSCVEMISGKNTIYVRAVDSGGRGFDLNLPAFCELCGNEGGFAAGGCNVNWRVVESSVCDSFQAGKTTPNCNLCPNGYTCGNPDPNFNAGVPWTSYCPSQVPLGTVTMKRCEMRIDGCTCYPPEWGQSPGAEYSYFWCAKNQEDFNNGICAGTCRSTYSDLDCAALGSDYRCFSNTYNCFGAIPSISTQNLPLPKSPPPNSPPPNSPPPNSPPPNSPPPNSPPPSFPTSGGQTTTRCGETWDDANSQCGADCSSELDCSAGQNCWASLSRAPCSTQSAGKTSLRCGSSWTDANGKCGSDCTNNIDCINGEYCWSALGVDICASNAISDETVVSDESSESGNGSDSDKSSDGSLTEKKYFGVLSFWGLGGIIYGVVVIVVIVVVVVIVKKKKERERV